MRKAQIATEAVTDEDDALIGIDGADACDDGVEVVEDGITPVRRRIGWRRRRAMPGQVDGDAGMVDRNGLDRRVPHVRVGIDPMDPHGGDRVGADLGTGGRGVQCGHGSDLLRSREIVGFASR